MAIRLEGMIITLIFVVFSIFYFIKDSDSKKENSRATKELEFHETSLIEVDQHEMSGSAFADSGVIKKGVLYLRYLRYHTNTIRLLRADSAVMKKEHLYLDGNISLKQKEGFCYQAKSAIYDKHTKILHIKSPFQAKLKQNTISGEALTYDILHKKATASMVKAVFYTSHK